MNSPNPLNFKPKLPSQTRHLDTFVMARLRDPIQASGTLPPNRVIYLPYDSGIIHH